MEAIFIYFFKVFVSSGVLFLYYQLSLKDKTFHHYNRFYLLSAAVISLFLPLLKVEDFTVEVDADLYFLLTKIQNIKTTNTINDDHIYSTLGFSALALVSVFLVVRLFVGIFKILSIRRKFKKETLQGINFYQTNLDDAPFSYFKNLFWKHSLEINSDLGKQILKHEMVHIEQKHSYDKIFMELLSGMFWFNPVFYFMKKELFLIHEYLADKKAVKQSDTKAFAQMLLAGNFSADILPGTNPFLSSNLKKRLKMIQKPQTKFGYLRRICVLPILFLMVFAYLVNAKNREIKIVNKQADFAAAEIFKNNFENVKTLQDTVIKPNMTKGDSAKTLTEDFNAKTDSTVNEYELFYRTALAKRESAREKQQSEKEKMLTTIRERRNAQSFDEIFSKNRNYEKEPLSKKEFEMLKKDADEILKNTQKISGSGARNMAIFQSDGFETIVFDRNGQIIKQKPAPVKSEISVMSVDADELFINGKRVSKEDFLKFQTEYKDLKNGNHKIKKMIIERVGDEKISYARKMSITTDKNSRSGSLLRYLINGKEVTKAEAEALSPSEISRVDVRKKSLTAKKADEIAITTKD
ncbi:hypothetical protein ASG01_01000 [Chryseobacterium sp. Leaf180]|uniref:M56 family metallopeptidase n=1 Tax=Chryseobacterium sp. Leaf180 TaxID=1736289 RepID=UPI0006F4FD41|nr:M56 family metallopeptidase [Chryseobacterium sp. Leaf180]KQR94491.1 hypothetical protein ASG01_01000 [Chryseobacterium sp. Leaf180]